jgi:hypothetical protein
VLPYPTAPGADGFDHSRPLAGGVQCFRHVDDQVAALIPVGDGSQPVRQGNPFEVDHEPFPGGAARC